MSRYGERYTLRRRLLLPRLKVEIVRCPSGGGYVWINGNVPFTRHAWWLVLSTTPLRIAR